MVDHLKGHYSVRARTQARYTSPVEGVEITILPGIEARPYLRQRGPVPTHQPLRGCQALLPAAQATSRASPEMLGGQQTPDWATRPQHPQASVGPAGLCGPAGPAGPLASRRVQCHHSASFCAASARR